MRKIDERIEKRARKAKLKALKKAKRKNMKQPIIDLGDTGYVYDEGEPENYLLGDARVPKTIIFPDGHGWGNHRPAGEKQYNDNGIDGWLCVLESGTNAIEYEMNRRLQAGIIKEGSDEFRFNNDLQFLYKIEGKWQFNANGIILGIMSGATGSGTSLNNGAETIRLKGLVGEEVYTKWKTAKSVQELLDKANLTQGHIDRAKKWLEKYEIKHTWVFNSSNIPSIADKLRIIKEELKYSVLQVAGKAWVSVDSKGYYNYTSGSANHAFVVEDYDDAKTIALDTYLKNQEYTKFLAPDYLFWQAKQFTIISKFPEVSLPPETEKEDIMIFYKRPNSPDIYQSGADGLYHPLFNESVFKALYGKFSQYEIKEVSFPDSQIGDVIYFKSSFINLILNFISKLGKRK